MFYFSRLCVYQDRINARAMTKRPVGVTDPNASPFSDKLPFSNRDLRYGTTVQATTRRAEVTKTQTTRSSQRPSHRLEPTIGAVSSRL